jgi:DUF1009 family protein
VTQTLAPGAPQTAAGEGALAIICGGGSLPFALADCAIRGGRRIVLFALRGWADPERVVVYPHHWLWIGEFGGFQRLAAQEGCHDVVFIGSVGRPSLWQIRPDLKALSYLPHVFRLYRGGDDHLLSGIGRVFEQHGFRLLSPLDIAPELFMPLGAIGTRQPTARDRKDIACGLALLSATSPFDIGQAVVVGDNQVLAIEGPEGTDMTLRRVAEMRRAGRIRVPSGAGVLVKAAKLGQDRRLDLPTIGTRTVESAAAAELAGIAVVAGTTIVADADRIVGAAERAKLFLIGVDADGAR